jgi:lipopolysaccharide export system ATP-binding protein
MRGLHGEHEEVGLILEAHGLSHSYADRCVLSGLSIAVASGEVVGLLGPNGAGKSTALGIIAGTLRPDSGSVKLHGKSIDAFPLWVRVRRGMGYLPQAPSVMRDLTVEENLLLAHRGSEPGPDRVRTVMEERGLASLADIKAGRLSGGERRRMELARALIGRPAVLVLDEPFAGVDPVGIEQLQSTIRELAASGIGVLLTDHSVHATLSVCNRAVILDAGTVMADGCPDDVVSNALVRKRYLGSGFVPEKTV